MLKEQYVLSALVVLTVAGLLFGALYLSGAQSPLIGTVRPALDLMLLSGGPTRLPVPFFQRHILILFTPACRHCRTLLEHYSILSAHNADLPCYAISLGSISDTDSFIRSSNISLPVFLDRDKSAQTVFSADRVPVVVFVDERDIIRLTLTGSRSFQEDSLLFTRFGRAGAPEAPGVKGQEGAGYRQFPDAPTADTMGSEVPSACLAEGVNAPAGSVGPRSMQGAFKPSGGPPQAAGPFIHRSLHKKEEPSCVPSLQG